MKILKVGIVLIVVILALTLLTLRVTGLEPQYLDLNDLRAHHMIARPGLWLKGEVVATPVTDWSFVDKVEHPGRSLNTVLVETRTPYFVPHSVRTMPFVRNGQLYIRSHQDRMDLQFPNDKSWTSNVARDPRVRIKIGDKLYEATMVLIADRAQASALLGRNPETLQSGPDGQEHVVGYDHIFRVFQRNIPEYGGNQPSPSSAGHSDSREDYLRRVRAAAGALAKDRNLLPEDVDSVVNEAGKHWDWTVSTLTSQTSN